MQNLAQKASEYQECKAFYQWTQYNPLIKNLVSKIVNEGKRTTIMGNLLKAIGFTRGFPDYQIFKANNKWHGLFIEMKTKDQSDKKRDRHQQSFITKLLNEKYYATFAYGADEAIRITEDYLANRI